MDRLARRLLWFALGGPLASLLFSLVALAIVLYLGSDLRRMLDYLWLWECSLFAAITSYFFLLTSLYPGSYHNGLVADGGRIVMLLTRPAEAARWQALVQLNVADLNGERPSAWDEQLLRQALTQPDNSHDYLTALVMNYHHDLDRKTAAASPAALGRSFTTAHCLGCWHVAAPGFRKSLPVGTLLEGFGGCTGFVFPDQNQSKTG
jgi:hypothetical protein